MYDQQSSRTAEYMALYRALESVRPPDKRLFHDPFAQRFIRPALRCGVWCARLPLLRDLILWYADHRLAGARASGIARTRLIDDTLRQSLREGIDQVVILGAGFDCRAYRLPELAGVSVWEVDHPATLAVKRARLQQTLAQLPGNVRFVEIDFNRQSLQATLRAASLDPQRPAVFVWEGVTNYLSADAVDAVLRYVAGCQPGSRLLFTYVHRGALDGSGHFADAPALLQAVAQLGEPWTFGLDPAELRGYLSDRGLDLEHDAGAQEYRAQYYGPAGARIPGYHFYRVAGARVPSRSDTPIAVHTGFRTDA